MEALSDPVLGVLIEAAAGGLRRRELIPLLMSANLYGWRAEEEYEDSKPGLLRSHLIAAQERAANGNTAAQRDLLTFTRLVVERIVPDPERAPAWFGDLREALRADGYELTWELEESDDPFGMPRASYQILPTDPTPVPLPSQITALEAELAARGYTTTLNHYKQAVDGLLNQKYESANGDLRTALEDLVTRLAVDYADYQRVAGPSPGQPRASQGGRAINHLVRAGRLPESEGGKLLQGLWDMIHTNGPHPGQSDAGEARFRMQIVTATARFLLKHFPAAS